MRRSPRLRPPPSRPPPSPPRTPPPVPAPPQAMAAPAAAGEGPEQEFEICNDEGFVYKVPRGLYPDAAPSSTQASEAAGPDPEIAGLRRRRRALLRLRAKRQRQLSRWEALASELLAPLPAPQPPASQSPSVSPHPVAGTASATAASASVLDELIAQADVQAELLRRASELCDQINALCDAQEAAIVDDIAALPVWGNPRELVASMYSPDPDEQADPGGLDQGTGGFQILECQQGKGAAVASAAAERVKIIGDKRIQSPSPCNRCSRFGCTGETCCEIRAGVGDELPSPVLTASRKRKGAVSPSSISNTPGPITRRKAASISRADIFGSPGPTTRRRAAAQHVPPRS